MKHPDLFSALADPHWKYIEKVSLEDFSGDDWRQMERQRAAYLAQQQAGQALRLLSASERDPTFGYMVNNYRHSLQSATMVLRDGRCEEDVVVALLHDVGFITCPLLHGDFAACLMGAYISDRNHWMLQHHATFQNLHAVLSQNLMREEGACGRLRRRPVEISGTVFHPLVTLSIGAVPVERGWFSSHHEISTAAADAKKQAKRMRGNSLFIERRGRSPPVS